MLNIGVIQMQSVPLKVERNLNQAGRMIDRVVRDGAQLVVLPEMFNVGFFFGEELFKYAEPIDGRTVEWLVSQVRQYHIYIVAGFYEHYKEDYYNTMVMIGPEGDVQHYRKRNPTWGEVAVWKRSEDPGPGIFETSIGRVGGVICFDSLTRETFEGFRLSEVDMVIIIACWGYARRFSLRPDFIMGNAVLKSWSQLASETVPYEYAVRLGVPVVFVNQGGMTITPASSPSPLPPIGDVDFQFQGNSHILDATGKLLAGAEKSQAEFLAVAPVELKPRLDRIPQSRVDIPANYLKKEYYFVQPPLIARLMQAWYVKALKNEYLRRKNKFNDFQYRTE